MFTKQHYETIALTMQELCPNLPKTDHFGEYNAEGYENEDETLGRQDMWDDVCSNLADMFQRDNSLFQRGRFIAACQPNANVKLRTRYKVVA